MVRNPDARFGGRREREGKRGCEGRDQQFSGFFVTGAVNSVRPLQAADNTERSTLFTVRY